MECRASIPSWPLLARLRKRGQKPAGALWITDNWRQRANLEAGGNFAVAFPAAEDVPYVAGLEVILIADQSERAIDTAQRIAAAAPSRFVTYFRGRGAEVVL